jgi:hypothetical protein
VTAFRHHLALHSFAAAWLVAFALAVRLIVPAGFMPMAGHAALEICAGQTMGLSAAAPVAAMPAMAGMPGIEAAHAAHHGVHADAKDHGGTPMSGASDHDCGFGAAIGGAANLPSLILPALPTPVALAAAFIHTLLLRPGLGLAAPPPPKTGPPTFLR